MIQHHSPLEVTEDGMALFVNAEQELAVGVQRYSCNVGPVRKGKSVRFVVDEVEDCHSVAHGRE